LVNRHDCHCQTPTIQIAESRRIDPTFGNRQILWFALSLLILWILFRVSKDLKWLQEYRYLWLSGGIFLLFLTLIFGTNPSGGEPKLWLGCCGFYFQPSEPLRLLLVAFLASFIADRMIYDWISQKSRLLRTLVPLLILWILSIVLLFVQRDLGTATLFILLLTVLLYIASSRWQVLFAGGVLTFLGILAAFLTISVVSKRFEAWLNPWLDPTGGSYQVVQSLISLANGGIFGRGIGNGSPGFVPAVHTDFIFAAITEETGLLGAIALLALFAVFVSRGIKIAIWSRKPFNKLLAAGISVAIGLQSIMIVGGVVRMLPLTGITLPYVSYGGSSLLTSFLGLGFLLILSNGEQKKTGQRSPLTNVHNVFLGAFLVASIVVGWWTVFRSADLIERSDNLRRAVADRYSKRGTIYDAFDVALSETTGELGNYERQITSTHFSAIVGHHSVFFGQAGIEESMDLTLRGETGDTIDVISSTILRGFPVSGVDIQLTIDATLQNSVAPYLDSPGALIILNSIDGKILALVSSPSYDANSIDQEWSNLVARDDAPLLNRTIQSRYQPGMAIAPFLISWAIENGQASLTMPIENSLEGVNIAGLKIDCSQNPPEFAPTTLGEALKFGCPSGLVSLAESFDQQFLVDAFHAFGFDRSVEIRLDSATAITAQTLDSSEKIFLAAIGQEEQLITPMQMARAYAGLVENGRLPALHLVDAIRRPDGGWELLEPVGTSISSVRPEVSQQIAEFEIDFGNNLKGFVFRASAGPGGDTLTWFLAQNKNHQIVVLVLEDGDLNKAIEIGTMALRESE
jgi:cell division protein FtsW (lipid II flippase)